MISRLVRPSAVRRATGSDAPICKDGRSGGFTELLARAEVSHDALIDFPSENACKASDDVPFRPSIRPASDDRVDRRLVIAHTDHDGSMEGGVRLSVAAPIEAVSTGGHPGGGGDGTRAAELGKGGFRANPLRVIPEDNEHRGGGVGANGEALPEGGRRLGGEWLWCMAPDPYFGGHRQPAGPVAAASARSC